MAKTFEFTGPDGKTYIIEGPDDATEEMAFQMLQAQLGDLGGDPAPGTDPGAGLPAPDGAPAGGPGMGAATPGPGGLGGAPVGTHQVATMTPQADPYRAAQLEAQDEMREYYQGLPAWQRFMIGAGESVYSTGKGLQQMYNRVVGDDKRLAELQEDEKFRRFYDAPIEEDLAGNAGQLASTVAQAYIPGGAMTRGIKGATMGMAPGAQLGAQIGGEALLGAGIGAVQPTIEGENVADNALMGGIAGGAGRAIPSLAGAAVRRAAPVTSRLASLVRGGKPAAESSARRAAGKELGEVMGQTSVPLGPLRRDLERIAQHYPTSLPPDLRTQIGLLRRLPTNSQVKGSALAEMRTAVNREAAENPGMAESGLQAVSRAIDNNIDANISSDLARRLRQARQQYRTGRAQPGLSPASMTAAAMLREARKKDPDEEEY